MRKFKFLSKESGSKVHCTSLMGIVVDDTRALLPKSLSSGSGQWGLLVCNMQQEVSKETGSTQQGKSKMVLPSSSSHCPQEREGNVNKCRYINN